LVASLFAVLGLIFLFGLITTIVQAFRAITPILLLSKSRGYTFFGDVASQQRESWRRRIFRARFQEIVLDLSDQVYTTSLIATAKNRHLQSSIRGVVYWLPSGLILQILSLQIA
jgi:hypothetical protein